MAQMTLTTGKRPNRYGNPKASIRADDQFWLGPRSGRPGRLKDVVESDVLFTGRSATLFSGCPLSGTMHQPSSFRPMKRPLPVMASLLFAAPFVDKAADILSRIS